MSDIKFEYNKIYDCIILFVIGIRLSLLNTLYCFGMDRYIGLIFGGFYLATLSLIASGY